MENLKHLAVSACFDGTQEQPVGTLAADGAEIYFEYDSGAVGAGLLNLSPFALPPKPGLIKGPPAPFEGLHGLFADSLPDGWGRLLVDRQWRRLGHRGRPSPLTRLAAVGEDGLGVLRYRPLFDGDKAERAVDLAALAETAADILADVETAEIDRFLEFAGSPGGARPKVQLYASPSLDRLSHAASDTTPDAWIVKFRGQEDPEDMARIEMAYWRMAQAAGLSVPKAHLFGGQYFGVKRFDRGDAHRRLHMHSAAGLLQADYRAPALDYDDLMRVTLRLTADVREVAKLFRWCVFNVLSHNRDDHAKNFAFLMDDGGEWHLSPAYDLTPAPGLNFEHSTMIDGAGLRVRRADLLRLAGKHGMAEKAATEVIEHVRAAVADWGHLAAEADLSAASTRRVQRDLARVEGELG